MKFLADEHIELSIVEGLKRLGIGILSVDEADMRGHGDIDILNYAKGNGRVLVTRDSDFLRLHAKGSEHVGIIYMRKFLDIGIVIEEIEKVSLLFEPEHLLNKVIMMQEVEMKLDEKAFRVGKSVCPNCGLKMHKIIENKSLFEGSLTFHIIKFHCEKCGRQYLDLEQAQVYDLFLIFNKKFAGKPLENLTRLSHEISLKG